MRRTLRLLTVLALACPAFGGAAGAQDSHKAEAQAAQAAAPTAAKRLDALIERYNQQQRDVSEAYEKAGSEEEKQRVLAGRPGKEYLPEFRALAEEAKGTDTAAQAWLWVLRLAREDKAASWNAVQTMLEDHMQSPRMAELTDHLRYASHQHGEAPVIEALRAIVDESPHEKARAGAMFTLGAVLLESKDETNKQEGRNCFEAVITEYGDVAYRDSTYKAAAQGFLYELDNLQIGMVAPDFETIDENGVKWRLSDYRGKVVVVDFWGFW